jgi:hypothetical protein
VSLVDFDASLILQKFSVLVCTTRGHVPAPTMPDVSPNQVFWACIAALLAAAWASRSLFVFVFAAFLCVFRTGCALLLLLTERTDARVRSRQLVMALTHHLICLSKAADGAEEHVKSILASETVSVTDKKRAKAMIKTVRAERKRHASVGKTAVRAESTTPGADSAVSALEELKEGVKRVQSTAAAIAAMM